MPIREKYRKDDHTGGGLKEGKEITYSCQGVCIEVLVKLQKRESILT